jgi:acetyl-CoA C-acetyltransferase
MSAIVIVSAKRTPIGAFRGQLASFSAPELGAIALRATLTEADLDPHAVDEVYMGCVLPAAGGQAPARQAALKAGIPPAVGCTTINKVCGSGMKAVMLGHDTIRAGNATAVLAGGMESMSNAPYLLNRSVSARRLGNLELLDHLMRDGLENPADGKPMGFFAERCVDQFGFTREEQDRWAAESVKRTLKAMDHADFVDEIAPIDPIDAPRIERDETPLKCDLAKIAKLKPIFRPENGTVTAANSSSISDGAAALLLMDEAQAVRLGIPPLAHVVGFITHAQTPEDFPTAPIAAIQQLYEKLGWHDADLYEINEAFAAVTLAAISALRLDPERVNVNGGACALGHPIGATGARIIVTLAHALKRRGLRRGIAALCIGGGEATAIALERP